MPIMEYECPAGHITEKIFLFSNTPIIIDCPICWNIEKVLRTASKIWSLPGKIDIAPPTKIFVNNKTGDIFTPQSRYDKPPNGFHEKELRNPIERSKFEKEQQHKVNARNQTMSHALDSLKSEARKRRHDNLNAKMNAIQKEEFVNKEGKKETIEFTLEEKDKLLVKKAMERSKKKPIKEKQSNVMLAINHQNSSNMDEVK